MAITSQAFNRPASTGLTSPAANAAANTKGAWTQLTAATTAPMDWLDFQFFGSSVAGSYLVDIGIGGAGAEVVILPNIALATALGSGGTGTMARIMLPFRIATGTRVAVRVQCTVGAGALAIYAGGQGGMSPVGRVFQRATNYGADVATSRGQAIDPGAVAHTKSAYVQLTAACTNAVKAFYLMVTEQAENIDDPKYYMDVAIGAGGAEVIVIPDIPLVTHYAFEGFIPSIVGPFFCDIAAGTRIAVRAQCSFSVQPDRSIDVCMLALDDEVAVSGGIVPQLIGTGPLVRT